MLKRSKNAVNMPNRETHIAMRIAFTGNNEPNQSQVSIDQMVSSINIIVDMSGLRERTAADNKGQSDQNQPSDSVDSSLDNAKTRNNYNGEMSQRQPLWPLSDVKRLLGIRPIRLDYKERTDGKGDWRNIGFTREMAKDAILSLTNDNFIVTHKDFKPYVDEYHLPYKLNELMETIYGHLRGGSTYLYIKIFIKNGTMVMTESFHWGYPK